LDDGGTHRNQAGVGSVIDRAGTLAAKPVAVELKDIPEFMIAP